MGYLLDTLDRASFANQQDVVRNERRQTHENTPYGPAEEALIHLLFPEGHPYYGDDHRLAPGHPVGQSRRRKEVLQAVLRSEQRDARNRRRLRRRADAAAGDEVFRFVEEGRSASRRSTSQTPPITSERRKVVPSRVELPRVSMAWLTAPILQAGRRRGGHHRDDPGRRPLQPSLQERWSTRSRSRRTSRRPSSRLQLQSIFEIDATARPGHTAEELEAAIDAEIAKLVAAPPDVSEMERAKNTFETSIVSGLESISVWPIG